MSQGTHGEPVNDSALSWVIDGHPTMPRDRGYFLDTSYRMHPEVCAPVSRLSYNGELRSAAVASDRHLESVAPGLEVVRLGHATNSVSSPEEADEVVRRVQSLTGTIWRNPQDPGGARLLGQKDFLVVAP